MPSLICVGIEVQSVSQEGDLSIKQRQRLFHLVPENSHSAEYHSLTTDNSYEMQSEPTSSVGLLFHELELDIAMRAPNPENTKYICNDKYIFIYKRNHNSALKVKNCTLNWAWKQVKPASSSKHMSCYFLH